MSKRAPFSQEQNKIVVPSLYDKKKKCFFRSDEGLTLEPSALQTLYGVQFTLSTPLIPNYLVTLSQRRSTQLL